MQLLPLCKVVPQVLEAQEKLVASGPFIWKPIFDAETLPELVIVRVAGALGRPLDTASKVI